MKIGKLITVIVVCGMVFSCVAAVVNAPTSKTASSYRSGTSCTMVQSHDGRGLTTTMDCN